MAPRSLIERRLAAAGHHTPIRSVYTWNGEIHDHTEARVALHTRALLFDTIAALTAEEHPYKVACVASVPLTNASEPYARWILESTGPESLAAPEIGDQTAMQTYPHGTVVVVFDCADLERSADFWCEVLGYKRLHPTTERYFSLVASQPRGVELLLQRVPEAKAEKNRVHFDLRTRDLDAEVRRVVAAGAKLITAEPYDENSWRWHIFADPDDNEFCVLQPPADFAWPTE